MSETAVLADIARLIRSKNAGPFWLTVDVMFDEPSAFRRALASDLTDRRRIAARLFQDPDLVIVTPVENALAIKVSFPRRHSAGSPRDSDVLGGQQYAALLDLPIP